MDSFGGIVNRFNDAAASAGDILRRNFMNSPTAGTMPPSSAASTNILSAGPVKLPLKPVPAAQLSTKQLLQGVSGPGVTPVKTVLNKPGAAAAAATAAGAKGAGGVLGATNTLIGGSFGAATLAGMSPGSTPLAGTDAEFNPGPLLKGSLQFPFIHTKGSAGYEAAGAAEPMQPIMRNIVNMGGVSYDVSTPEGKAGYDAAQAAGLKAQGGTTPKALLSVPNDYKATEAAAFEAAAEAGDPQPNFIRAAAGTDTSTGLRDRGPAASEFVGKEDEAMAIWAKANPKLAQAMVEKVERARVNSPDFKQTGYDAVKKYLDPSYDKDARSQTFGPVANAEEYGRNLALQGTGGIGPVSDAGLYGDLLEGKEKPNTQTFKTAKEKVQKRLSTTTDKSNETAAALPPSVTQNPNFDPEITSQYNAAGLKGGGVTRRYLCSNVVKSQFGQSNTINVDISYKSK